jgi:hypothetical protein
MPNPCEIIHYTQSNNKSKYMHVTLSHLFFFKYLRVKFGNKNNNKIFILLKHVCSKLKLI